VVVVYRFVATTPGRGACGARGFIETAALQCG